MKSSNFDREFHTADLAQSSIFQVPFRMCITGKWRAVEIRSRVPVSDKEADFEKIQTEPHYIKGLQYLRRKRKTN